MIDVKCIDNFDNTKLESPTFQKGESILSKSVCYNIQSIQSVNINTIKQNECENPNSSQEATLSTVVDPIALIVDALLSKGLSQEKLNYPDALPEIGRLSQAGAGVDLFLKAYEISARATKNFGIRYLAKVVGSLLEKYQRRQKKYQYPYQKNNRVISVSLAGTRNEYVYQSDFQNAKSWASDLL